MCRFFYVLPFLFSGLLLSGCDINFGYSPGSLEDMDRPKVIEGLAPLPEGYYDYALETTKLFFVGGREAISDRLHPVLDAEPDRIWKLLDTYASDKAEFDKAEYFGHGFGEDKGIQFTVVQIKVPFEGGYNLVQMTMPSNEECCRLAGINVEAKMIKSFSLSK